MELGKEIQRLENQVPALPVSTGPKTGELQGLATALQSQKVAVSNVKELSEVLRYVMVLIGLKAENFPSQEEKPLLLAHIFKYYAQHTLGEIRLAFEMALAGGLDIDRRDISCYENFSCQYFSRIMNSYRRWAGQEVKQIPEPAPKGLEKPADAGKEEESMLEWWGDFVAKVKAGGYKVEYTPMSLYKWKEEKGETKLPASQKYWYLERAVERIAGQLKEVYEENLDIPSRKAYTEFLEMKEKGEVTGASVEQVRNLAKRMLLYDLALNEEK